MACFFRLIPKKSVPRLFYLPFYMPLYNTFIWLSYLDFRILLENGRDFPESTQQALCGTGPQVARGAWPILGVSKAEWSMLSSVLFLKPDTASDRGGEQESRAFLIIN